MPTTQLKHLAKRAKVSIGDVEHKWEHAKKIVKKEYNVSEDDPSFYALTTGITKKMLGINEDKKTFKRYLMEMNYGSLVDTDRLREMDKADQELYKYTADGFTHIGPYVTKLTKRYPYEGGTLYRGLHFDDHDDHDKFLEKIKDGVLKTNDCSSWTPHESTAADFAHSKKTYFPTMDIMMAHKQMQDEGEHMSGYGGIVISTEVGPNVGIDVRKTDYAKESEVILPEGEYQVKIVKLTEPHKRRFGTKEAVLALIDEIKTAERSKELDSKIEYVVKSWLLKDLLSEKEADILMNYELRKFMTMSKEDLRAKYSSITVDKKWSFDKDDNSHRLQLDIWIPIDERIFNKCSDKMKGSIRKQIAHIAAGVKAKIDELMKEPKLELVDEFDVRGMDALRHFTPELAGDVAKPLRTLLGKKYHEMNDRKVTKNLTDYHDIRKHGDKIAKIVNAIAQL